MQHVHDVISVQNKKFEVKFLIKNMKEFVLQFQKLFPLPHDNKLRFICTLTIDICKKSIRIKQKPSPCIFQIYAEAYSLVYI